jgi:ribonucleoside-diphosphate reductase alpha chain
MDILDRYLLVDEGKYNYEEIDNFLIDIFNKFSNNRSKFISSFEEALNYGEPENYLDKETIDNAFNALNKSGLIDQIKNSLKSFYKTEDLIEDFFLQNISYEVYSQKYQLKYKDIDNEMYPVDKTPFHTIARVALAVSLVSTRYSTKIDYKTFRNLFVNFFYMLAMGYSAGGGRIMANAGSSVYKTATSLINCTVMSQIPDSMEGIMDVLKDAALSLKSGAGVGYDFSTIRPKGSFVQGAGADTSGVTSFVEIYDKMCSTIMSAGGRRGAQMAVIDIQHPESIEFFQAKRKDGTLRYFNISLALTDKFINAVKNDLDFEQWFWEFDSFIPKDELIRDMTFKNEKVAIVKKERTPFDYSDFNYFVFEDSHMLMKYEKVTEGFVKVYKKKVYNNTKASELYDVIMNSTYDYAEPGIIFIDRINENNILNEKEYIRTTNPCGEQPLPPYGSCNLGSIFVHRFVKSPFSKEEHNNNFDFENLEKTAFLMNIFLDFVNDITNLPLVDLKRNAYVKRRHGLGISGIADLFIMSGLIYGEKESIDFTENIMKTIQKSSLIANIYMSNLISPAQIDISVKDWFRVFPHLKNHVNEISSIFSEDKDSIENLPLRFSHGTSIAPTGTMSLTWGNNVANGIEPVFSISYLRNIRVPGKKTKVQEEVFDFAAILYKNMFGNFKKEDYFVTTDEITVQQHVNVQAAAQKYVDSAISKTCNIPTDYPFEDFKKAYLSAHEMRLKGFTTFRFNPKFSVGVLVKEKDLENMSIEFELDNGEKIVVKGSEKVFYDGEEHVAANLYEAIKENIYGKM